MPRLLVLLLVVVLSPMVVPPPLAAQSEPGLGSDDEVGASISTRLGMAWLGSRSLPIGAIAGTLRLSDRLELGGEAVVGLQAIALSPGSSPDRTELTMGYGGLLLRWRPAGDVAGIRWGGSLHLGAGTARIRSVLAESTIVTENYFLLEPRIGLLLRQDRRLRVSAEAGYRITAGADDLPGIRVNELRGPSLTFGAQVVFDPDLQL